MCDVTARFALIGQPSAGGSSRAAKLLRIAAFVSVTPDFNLRVYSVDDTIDAVQVCCATTTRLNYLLTFLQGNYVLVTLTGT